MLNQIQLRRYSFQACWNLLDPARADGRHFSQQSISVLPMDHFSEIISLDIQTGRRGCSNHKQRTVENTHTMERLDQEIKKSVQAFLGGPVSFTQGVQAANGSQRFEKYINSRDCFWWASFFESIEPIGFRKNFLKLAGHWTHVREDPQASNEESLSSVPMILESF